MKIEWRTVTRYILIALIIATLLFIFIQSMLPKEKSHAESDAVGGIISEIIPPDTPAGEYVQKNIRKIAHFTEFAVLGGEIALYIILFMPKIRYMLLSYPTALILALLDETVQIFSGRGPAVSDVWIDFLGFLSASAVFYVVYAVICFIQCKRKQ